jgi:hypothetical protein
LVSMYVKLVHDPDHCILYYHNLTVDILPFSL